MENWRRFVKKTSFKTDMGHLYLFEGRKIKKVSFEKRFNQLNESNRSLEKFVKEWEKSCDYTFTLLERKELLNEGDLQFKIGVQILMMVSRIKKWSMKLIMPVLRVISKVSKYTNKYPILKKISKLAVMLIISSVLIAAGPHADAGGDFTELLNWLIANADIVDPEVVENANLTLSINTSGEAIDIKGMGYYFDSEDLVKEVHKLRGELQGTEKSEELSQAVEKALNSVSDAAEGAPEVEAAPEVGQISVDQIDVKQGKSPQGDLQLTVELPSGKKLSPQELAKIAKANGITGGYSTINNSGKGMVIITAGN